jgi:outer membrane protein OmpA-like peptidoglycan-associated protein
MGFNYDRIRRKEEEGHTNWWTSYADLFMMLSVVFLLMYVASSLRSGSMGYLKQQEFSQLAKENHDLKEQIKVYNTLKEQQLQTKSEQEQAVYAKLMDKLQLLKEETREEKESLQRQAKENEEKEFALNEYQQLIRNIINANILAKAQIQRREQIIESQDQTISTQERAIRDKEQLIARNESMIQNINSELAAQIDKVKREQKWARLTKKQMEKRIADLREESAGKVEALQAKSAEAERELGEAKQALASQEQEKSRLTAKMAETEGKLAGAEKEKGRYLAAVEGLKKENAAIQSDLEKTRALANARRDLAKNIQDAFHKAGIKADVNGGTGEVTLDFGDEYFDTGSSQIKPQMRKKLDQFFPIYAQSLFNNKKTAEKIGSVELVGFASSTYKGKYVNPTSLKPEDREAVSYNLKLSFARAQEIFKHVYNHDSMTDEQKKKLLPMIKVVGRGYLPDGAKASDIPEGIHEDKFCKLYNCKKAQRVIVKFNFKD